MTKPERPFPENLPEFTNHGTRVFANRTPGRLTASPIEGLMDTNHKKEAPPDRLAYFQ
jgi:hypothetical protein